jgi:hypothetical protein
MKVSNHPGYAPTETLCNDCPSNKEEELKKHNKTLTSAAVRKRSFQDKPDISLQKPTN